MDDFDTRGPQWPPEQGAAPHRSHKWFVIGGLALAFALTLGIGALAGSVLHPTAQAASATNANAYNYGQFGGYQGQFADNGPQYPLAGTPPAQGQCDLLTVTSVSGQTILAKDRDGNTVTIHTTSSTQYTRAGQSATASAVATGSQIHVTGTHNSDGSITATRIDVG